MTQRERPRMNLTLDPEVKEETKEISEELGVPVSRLIEEVLREFMKSYEEDPMVARRISKKIQDRKRQSDKDEGQSETIQNILNRMDEID